MAVRPAPETDPDAARLRGWIVLAIGLMVFAFGAIVFAVTSRSAARSTATQVATFAPLVAGAATAIRGIWRLVRAPTGAAPRTFEVRGLGYKSFVAWRYLLVAHRKVQFSTTLMLSGGLGGQVVLVILRAAGVTLGEPGGREVLAILQLVDLVFVGVVVFAGVLRHSKPALIAGLVGLGVLGLAWLGFWLTGRPELPLVDVDPGALEAVHQAMHVTRFVGAGVAGLAIFFGCLRARFTFFTTVPIGGVWIGTSALVIVLSVMGGFESDLRQKILGSNAHLQLAREDGDFVEWREIKARIDGMPGVVASTPFAVSEVVIAANNTGMNVIIKGIDPETVGKVTDLVSDLEPEDRNAMRRLDPIADDSRDLNVPQRPRPGGAGEVIDPPPDDLPNPGEPIDFSRPEPEPEAPEDRGRPGGTTTGSAGSAARPPAAELPEAREPFGGDAHALVPDDDTPITRPDPRAGPGPALDPPPPDLVTSDEPPIDYSTSDDVSDSVVKVIDIPFESPSRSRRTQSLPGILVGRELVKQTHLYTGDEVRVVSPLSDPANPDATGTPIPFNRDYRVAGRFFTGMYEYDLKYVYVTLSSLQEFLDRGDTIDGIEVRVDNPYNTDAFVARFQAAFGPQFRVQDWKELNRSLFSALKLEKIAMFLVLGIVILVASFSIVGNLIMVVVEKAREIALLKTLGASDVGVMQLFAIQGLMIGVIGTVLGVITGLSVCWALQRYGFPLDADVYYIDRLPVHVDPVSVLAAASAGVLISIAATLYPAVVAARVRPAAGMRH